MAFRYRLFDLITESDRSIPDIPLEETLSPADICVHLGTSPSVTESKGEEILWYESSSLDDTGKSALQIWKIDGGQYLRADYFDGTRFWLEPTGKIVWVLWGESSSFKVAISYLIGPIFGLLLRLRGITCLHASAVNIGGRGAIFIGPPGAGKSTTAAALALRGHAVLSDDIVALAESDDSLQVLPAYPHLSLWPDSTEILLGSRSALIPLAEDSDKRRLPLADTRGTFGKRAVSIADIYLLGERLNGSGAILEEVSPQEALILLISNVFGANLPTKNQAPLDLARLAKLLGQARVRRIHPDADPHQIFSLCECIESDVAAKPTVFE